MAELTVIVDTLPEPRRGLLNTLKHCGPRSVLELARQAGLSPSGIRAHMALLVSDGYVEVRPERHGVGRPSHRYALSASGDALFPRSYSGYVQMIFDAMERREPGSASAAIRGMFDDRAAKLRPRVADPDLYQSLSKLRPFLASNGFLPEIAAVEDESCELRLVNCPVLELAREFPAHCEHELAYLGEVLDAQTVKRRQFRLAGDSICVYRLARSQGTSS